MAIDSIIPKEPANFFVHLSWPHLIPPIMYQALPHAPRPKLMNLSKASKDAELVVRHPHVYFVGLDIVSSDWFKLSSRRCVDEVVEDWEVEICASPLDKRFQVRLRDSTDRVNVSAGTIVFGQVSSEELVHVGRSENE